MDDYLSYFCIFLSSIRVICDMEGLWMAYAKAAASNQIVLIKYRLKNAKYFFLR